MNDKYGDQATFLAVYVREAHPIDGWRMASNDRAGVAAAQPRTIEERVELAKQCAGHLETKIPVVVDEINDIVGNAYSGMPDRLYVIDSQGRVAYKGGRGPFGYNPAEMEQTLAMLLLDESAAETQNPQKPAQAR